jgi:hypothetical protein
MKVGDYPGHKGSPEVNPDSLANSCHCPLYIRNLFSRMAHQGSSVYQGIRKRNELTAAAYGSMFLLSPKVGTWPKVRPLVAGHERPVYVAAETFAVSRECLLL